MTPEQIEARDYTYCSATYGNPLTFRKFLVGSPLSAEAKVRALAYATKQWGEPVKINLYPRNYVAKARALFADGMHD